MFYRILIKNKSPEPQSRKEGGGSGASISPHHAITRVDTHLGSERLGLKYYLSAQSSARLEIQVHASQKIEKSGCSWVQKG